MPSSSLRDGLISKQDINTLENIDEIVEVGESSEANANKDTCSKNGEIAASTSKDALNPEVGANNDDHKLPNETLHYLNDKLRKKKGVHLALSRVSNVFLLFIMPLCMLLSE